jgi:hypothetical protein
MARQTWQVRPSTLFGLTLLTTLLVTPLPGAEDVTPFIGLLLYFLLKKQGHIKKFTGMDVLLIILYLVVGLIGLFYLTAITLAATPWWKILLVGVAADIVATVLSPIPIAGDLLSGIVNAMMAVVILGGLAGSLIAITVFFLSLFPGPSFGFNTLALLSFKVIAGWI